MPELRNFERFLERNNISSHVLARALQCSHTCVLHAIKHGTPKADFIQDVNTLLEQAGYKSPRNLWVDTNGRDVSKREKPLLSLLDFRVIPAKPRSAAAAERKQLKPGFDVQKLLKGEKQVQPLSPEAIARYGLHFDPFADEVRSRADIWWSKEHSRVLDAIKHACKRLSFVALVGEVGCGKTIIKKVLRDDLTSHRDHTLAGVRIVEPEFPDKRSLTPNNILDAIILSLAGENNIRIPARREQKAHRVRSILEAMDLEGQSAILFLDEAHDYSREAIRSLKRMHEALLGFKPMLGIVLIGQPELKHRLADATIREVAQRCRLIEMTGLGRELPNYLRFKVKAAGGNADAIFEKSAFKTMEEVLPTATPLFANIFATAAMNMAASTDEPITAELIDKLRPQRGR